MEHTTVIEQQTVKRKGRIPKGSKKSIEKRIIECNKSLQHPTQQNVADQVGVCRQTVANVLAKYKINQDDLEEYKINQPDILMGLQQRISGSIDDECIQKATMKDRLVALGIVIDKHRLITGQSTSNIASWTHVVSESHKAQVIDNAKVAHSTAECDKDAQSVD